MNKIFINFFKFYYEKPSSVLFAGKLQPQQKAHLFVFETIQNLALRLRWTTHHVALPPSTMAVQCWTGKLLLKEIRRWPLLKNKPAHTFKTSLVGKPCCSSSEDPRALT